MYLPTTIRGPQLPAPRLAPDRARLCAQGVRIRPRDASNVKRWMGSVYEYLVLYLNVRSVEVCCFT